MSPLNSLLNVIIALEEPAFAELVRLYIKNWKGINNITPVNNSQQLQAALKNEPSTVLLIDVQLPGIMSLGNVKKLLAENHLIRSLIFYSRNEELYIHTFNSLKTHGYISRLASCAKIKTALHNIFHQGTFYDEPFENKIQQNGSPAGTFNEGSLAPREFEVLQLLKKGRTPASIRSRLTISNNTYRQYRKQINIKLKEAGFPNIKNYIQSSN